MKFKHFGIFLLLIATLFFACKQDAGNQQKQNSSTVNNGGKKIENDNEKEIEMEFKIKTSSNAEYVALQDVIPSTGIPYTATHKEINTDEAFIIKAIAKGKETDISADVKDMKKAPLEISKVSSSKNSFKLVFKKVDVATTAKIVFSYYEGEGNSASNKRYKELEIIVLPEPTIEMVKAEDVTMLIGLDYDLKNAKVFFTCNPAKIGTIDSSKYLLKASKALTYIDSSLPAVATVTAEGVVHALQAGETNIKIKTKNGKEGAIKVKVENKSAPTSISCTTEKIILLVGESQNIVLTPTPADAILNLTDWECTNEEVGKIEKAGKDEFNYTITALKKGVTTFSASSKYNANAKISITLEVAASKVESIAIEHDRIFLGVGEVKQLKVVATPNDASTSAKWESSKPDFVKVNENGQIEGLQIGNAHITATSLSDSLKKATCVVIVSEKIEKLELDREVAELIFGESVQLSATVTPSTAPQGVLWSAEKMEGGLATDLIEITTDGRITAKNKVGYVRIIAKSDADASKKAECVVSIAEKKIERVSATPHHISMYTNSTKTVEVRIFPDEAAGEFLPDIKGENLKIEKVERESFTNKYTITLKSGDVEESKTITFFSKTNPEKKAEVTVSVEKPKVQYITVEDKTIALNQTTEKMVANVFPEEALQTVTWTSKNTSIVDIDATTGMLIPIGIGEAQVVATSTEDATKTGEATVTVKASLSSFSVKSIEPTSIYYGSSPAIIKFETNPIGSFGGFVFETENQDLEFVNAGDAIDPNKFKIKVKNANAKTANVTFKVRSSVNPSLPEKTEHIKIETIVPTSLTIEGSDGLYLDEVAEFTVKANDATPSPDKTVEWTLEKYRTWDSPENAPLERLKLEKISYSGGTRLSIKGDKKDMAGKKLKLVATSTLDATVKAEKVITMYKNVAKIASVEYSMKEYTLTSTEKNNKLYNKGNAPVLKIKLSGNVESQHLVFFVSEHSSFATDEDYSDVHFKNSFFKIQKEDYDSATKTATFRLLPKRNTKGEEALFYVHAIDPKSGYKYEVAKWNYDTFNLRIWDEPNGIVVKKGNFNIYDHNEGGYESGTIAYGTSGYTFYVRTRPEFANPNYIVWEAKNSGSKYMCIQDPTCSDSPDQYGNWRFEFRTSGNNSIGAHDYARFWFYIRVPDEKGIRQELSTPISNYLLIDSN